jgi:exonuclease III
MQPQQQLQSATKLTIVTFNTNGLSRNSFYVKYLSESADILFIQETWLHEINENDFQDLPTDFDAYCLKRPKEAGKRGRAEGTNAWLIRTSLKNKIKVKFISNRLSLLTVSFTNISYNILGCYLNSSNNVGKYQEELGMIHAEINKLVRKKKDKIILLGDLNGDIRRNQPKDVALAEFFEKSQIIPINVLNKQRNTNTFLSWQRNFSYLDYIDIRQPWEASKEEFTVEWPEVERVNDVLSEKEIESMIKCVINADSPERTWELWQEQCGDNWETTNQSDHRPVAMVINVAEANIHAKPKPVEFKRIQWLNKAHQEAYNKNLERLISTSDIVNRLKLIESGTDTELKAIALEKWIDDLMRLLLNSKHNTE